MHYTRVWSEVENRLPAHLQDIARNIRLLQKSKEDAIIDAKQRANRQEPVPDEYFSDGDDGDFDGDVYCEGKDLETLLPGQRNVYERFGVDSLLCGINVVQSQWRRQDDSNIKHIEAVSQVLEVTRRNGDFTKDRHLHEIADYRSTGLHSIPSYILENGLRR